MVTGSFSIELFRQIEETKKFNSFKEIYLFLKEKASVVVTDILDHNQALLENLIQICTNPVFENIGRVEFSDPNDDNGQKLLTLAKSQFDAGSFLGTLEFSVDLRNYLRQKTDKSYKNFIIYITFKYSPDNDSYLYFEEISEDRHLNLEIPDSVFYRYLPLLYGMTFYENCLNVLERLQKIPGGRLSRCEWVNRY